MDWFGFLDKYCKGFGVSVFRVCEQWQLRQSVHLAYDQVWHKVDVLTIITKTRLFKYIENFTSKNLKFSDKKSDIFHILLKTYIVGTR